MYLSDLEVYWCAPFRNKLQARRSDVFVLTHVLIQLGHIYIVLDGNNCTDRIDGGVFRSCGLRVRIVRQQRCLAN
jgi:hypothetical protein